jgi:tRNA (mo5U34)-methyltransferase
MPQRSTTRPARAHRDELVARVENLAPWFHNMDLGGIMTAPDHGPGEQPGFAWDRVCQALPADLGGKTVLDIDCNAGFHAIEMKRRGAARVVGIDSDPRHLQQAGLAAEILGVDIELRRLSVYEVADLGERFDLVLFTGVLRHLRYPLLALDLVREHVAGDVMVVQTMSRSDCQAGERFDPAGAEAMLRSAGFAIEAPLEEGVYICRAACPRKDEP